MIRKISVLTILALTAVMLYAQGDKSIKITGNLIDNACAESAKDLDTKAKNHSTSCAMMDGCEKSGYAVMPPTKNFTNSMTKATTSRPAC